MRAHTRLTAVLVLFLSAGTAGPVLAQGGVPAPAGRGGGAANKGGFTQFTRPPASQDVLVRGKSVYEANCSTCHAADMRGTPRGTNLQRSGMALNDQKGELVATAIAAHKPAITLVDADTAAIAEYIHSILAMSGGSGSPSSGRIPTGITLNVLVGNAATGEPVFRVLCSSCHSVTGDLKGIGGKFADPRALQNAWVSGSAGAFGGGGGGNGGNAVTVTMADGSKLEGTLIRTDDFLVVLRLADGTRRTIARNNGVPTVDVKDRQPHKDLLLKLAFSDEDNTKLHDITAYLWSLK